MSSQYEGTPADRFSNKTLAPYMKVLYATVQISVLASALQWCLCLYGLSRYLRSPEDARKYRLAYLLVGLTISFMFIISCVADSVYLAKVVIRVPRDFSFFFLYDHWLGELGSIANVLVTLIGDGLLVYRCHIIWTDYRWVVILPALSYLATIALGLLAVIRDSTNSRDFQIAWISSSAFVNASTTGLIALRLFQHQRRLKAALDARHLAKYSNASAILIETALPFTIFGVAAAIVAAKPRVASHSAAVVVNAVWFCLSALCPQIIIFRVITGSSYRNSEMISGEASLGPLQFASPGRKPPEGEDLH